MSYEEDAKAGRKFFATVSGVATAAVLAIAAISLVGCPKYNVYSKEMAGRAAYVEAVQNRRIKVLEAQAELDSSSLKAQAEVARAHGTNSANEIMAKSLGGPDNYLRWSYIHMLEETAGKGDRQIIYVATDGGMPILEAGRAVRAPTPAAE